MKLRTSIGLFVLLATWATPTLAQLEVNWSQYQMDPMILNPAATGLNPCMQVLAGHRRQWTSSDYPLQSSVFALHSSPNRKGDVKQFKTGWHGFGLLAVNDQDQEFTTNRISAAYAYHLRLRSKAVLSLGIFMTYRTLALNSEAFFVRDPDDPAIESGAPYQFFPEFTPGIWYNTNRLFAGISLWNLNNREADFLGRRIGSPMDLRMHTYAMAGYRFTYGGDYFHILPSTLIRYSRGFPPSFDLNVMWSYDYRFNVSAGYRLQDALLASVQFVIARSWKIGYAYDYTISRMSAAGQHTHEIMITFSRCLLPGPYINPFWCPAYAQKPVQE